MSINKFVNDAHIYVFDNSDKETFKNTFSNVNVIDNTNSQIINFDEFLNKYPKRHRSPGRLNNWASAKHCYTILKCIDMIDLNFMLLDSDVLLKCDVSDLFNDDYIYVGEIIKQPCGRLRVAPYMCFINVNMCKENNVKFFDENYMHGLYVGKWQSDMFDTGGGFLINTEKYNHLNVKIDDYAIHYAHGSWTKNDYEYQMTPDEFFEKYKVCWN